MKIYSPFEGGEGVGQLTDAIGMSPRLTWHPPLPESGRHPLYTRGISEELFMLKRKKFLSTLGFTPFLLLLLTFNLFSQAKKTEPAKPVAEKSNTAKTESPNPASAKTSDTKPAVAKPAAAKPAAAKVASGKSWKVLADIPFPQIGCAGAVLNDQLHILGGCTLEGGASNKHQVYDPSTNSWVQKAVIPDKAGWPAVAVFKGKIYLFGGDNKGIDARPVARSFVYDPEKDSWSEIAPLPAPRSYAAATAVGEFIYIYGARTLVNDKDDLSTYRYDPEENNYTRMADLPEAARFITQGYYNGNIYVLHGETSKEVMADGILRYDIVHNSWTKLDIPRPIKAKWTLTQHSTQVFSGSKLFVAGGKPPEAKRTPMVISFDMKTKQFGKIDPLPAGRCCGAGGVINGKLFLAGGFWEEVEDLVTCKPTWSHPLAE
jgi:N-acetylneuraminic acid mutarotase